MSTDPSSLRLSGAVDLGALARPSPASTGAAGPAGSSVVDVTETTFQAEVLERSQSVPVVIDFWADWCGPCKQLSPILERLAQADGGSWVLAKIDVDANPRIAQAAQVQGIPAVKAVVGGQMVGEFTGAIPESQARQWIDQVLEVAGKAGLPGPDDAPAEGAEEESGPPAPQEVTQAEQALVAGDLDAAAAAYQALLDRVPGDTQGRIGLARVGLLRRMSGLDEREVRRAAAERRDDVAAQTQAADLDMLGGHVDDAVARLVDLVRRSGGEDRGAARAHLLELFEVLDPDDPRLAAGRRALANALF